MKYTSFENDHTTHFRGCGCPHQQAYRGYLLVQMFDGSYSIQRDQFHIGSAHNFFVAKRSVDELLD